MTRLIDPFGRVSDYLRISVLEQCNLRCIYCMPADGLNFKHGDQILRTDEVGRVVQIAASLGIRKIRFTGGEPLLRRDIVELVRCAVRTRGIESVHLTTNGTRLVEQLPELSRAGLHGVNISLDTVRRNRFEKITRRDLFEQVLAAIDCAIQSGVETIKVNVVVMRGINDDEVPDFAALTERRPITVRFIELMPFDADQLWKTGKFCGSDRMVGMLRERYPRLLLEKGSATETLCLKIPEHRGRLAFIPSYSRNLCGTCNRLRLTADGYLRNCLYSEDEFPLLQLLRNGGTDEDLAQVFRRATSAKLADGWLAQRASKDRRRSSMTQVGG